MSATVSAPPWKGCIYQRVPVSGFYAVAEGVGDSEEGGGEMGQEVGGADEDDEEEDDDVEGSEDEEDDEEDIELYGNQLPYQFDKCAT